MKDANVSAVYKLFNTSLNIVKKQELEFIK